MYIRVLHPTTRHFEKNDHHLLNKNNGDVLDQWPIVTKLIKLKVWILVMTMKDTICSTIQCRALEIIVYIPFRLAFYNLRLLITPLVCLKKSQSRKNGQCNRQNKKTKTTNNDLQNTTQKPKRLSKTKPIKGQEWIRVLHNDKQSFLH